MLILMTTVIAGAVSLLSKIGVEKLNHPLEIIGSFLQITLSYNAGIAFGIAIPSPWQEILILIALTVIVRIAQTSARTRWAALAFGLILGGAISNLIDRIPDGLVTDFILVGTFPLFNIADACITIGAGMLLLESFKKKD